MAEPIGVASGLLTLVTFAFQASVTLYETVQSFKVHPKRVRDLNDELTALSGVLQSLTDTITASTDTNLSALNLPLLRCGNACTEFEQELLKCTSRSGGSRTSFRDWAKLRYMGYDIDGFRQLLAGYKSTLTIGLTDANLRNSVSTAEKLEGHRDLIQQATSDLEEHLQDIDEKLENILARTVVATDSDAAELRLIKEERLSTQKGLQICAQLSDHIDEIQSGQVPPGPVDPNAVPGRVVHEGLRECKNSLRTTATRLEKHMHEVIDRLLTKSKTSITSEDELTDLASLQEEWKTARKCIEICSEAELNLNENISIIDNYATGDETVQFLVSTNGKTIHGKNRGYGWKTRQVGGHLSDASLQQISQDYSDLSYRDSKNTKRSPQGRSPPAPDDTVEVEPNSDFGNRFGRGFQLKDNSEAAKR